MALHQVRFSISPYIAKKEGKYYLIYQVDTTGEKILNRLVIREKTVNNKFYYFFIGKSSFREYNNMVIRPFKPDAYNISLIDKDLCFWLNPDNSEVKLKIISE